MNYIIYHYTKRGRIGLVLTRPCFIEGPVSSQKSEWSCICVQGVSILPLSTIFPIVFASVRMYGIVLVFVVVVW
jgi:hypothetical protein